MTGNRSPHRGVTLALVSLRMNTRQSVALAAIAAMIAGVVGFGAPAQAASVIHPDDRAGFRVLWSQAGAWAPSLSVGPEVGWNAGLEGLRPLGASYYRLWDMKVAWRDVNPAPGAFDWSILDQRIAQVESWGGRPIMVLGLTPQWAAADPNAGDPRWGAGTASPPADIETWRAYVRALVQRYGSRIGAYEIWNEANLQTFWTGTPQQMADMVRVATEEIGATSISLAPSVTTRLKSGPDFTANMAAALTPATIAELDAWSIHTYPAGDAGPTVAQACEQRVDDIIRWQEALIGVSRLNPSLLLKPVWDTEVNYGLAGPGARPGIDWSDSDGAALLQCTYQDSRALGIAVTAWYEFTASDFDLLGVQMNPQTPQINAAWTQLAETSKVTNPWIPSLGPASSASGPVASEQRGDKTISIIGKRGSSDRRFPDDWTCRQVAEWYPGQELPRNCVLVTGITSFPKGTWVTAEWRRSGEGKFKASQPFKINADGSFVWYLKTGSKTYVRMVIDDERTNTVTIPAR